MEWLKQPCLQPNQAMINKALEHQAQLTKPPGALGVLEQIAVRLAGLQHREHPKIERVHISVFAADHGVAAEGVSAFPQEVTAQMVSNFLQGGAAINVLARETGAHLEIIDVGTRTPLPANDNLMVQRAGPGTANSAQQAAMTHQQLEAALQAGHAAVERALTTQVDLFIGGEMGIANTTAATALYCALLDQTPEQMTGAGTGLDKAGISHKVQVIRRIVALHQAECTMDLPSSPLDWLRCVGGFEIAALTAAIVRAAQTGIPFLVDGFIVSAAALVAYRINPAVRDWLIFSHQSAEQGHAAVLTVFEANRPLLDLGLRLGEGSGAAAAIPLLRLACSLHNQMATFAEATVAGKIQ